MTNKKIILQFCNRIICSQVFSMQVRGLKTTFFLPSGALRAKGMTTVCLSLMFIWSPTLAWKCGGLKESTTIMKVAWLNPYFICFPELVPHFWNVPCHFLGASLRMDRDQFWSLLIFLKNFANNYTSWKLEYLSSQT